MKKIDLSVIGSGIGGSLISILNKDKDLILFEKDKKISNLVEFQTSYKYLI